MTQTIYLENTSLAYHGDQIFSNINLHLPAGKWTALLGQSGVGKSSLLRMIAGLTSAQETIQGSIHTDHKQSVTNQIAYMGQTDSLLPWLNVLDNTLLGLKLQANKPEPHRISKQKAETLLAQTGLGHAVHLYPHQLSGGMRQRAALARTLMQEKPIVLMDEPFSALDAITRYHLQNLAADLLCGKTVLFITHDPAEAARLAHEIYIMHGRPASLTHASSISSSIPRELNAPETLLLQQQLFAALK